MIKLDTRNGHDQCVIEEFNRVSRHLEDSEILLHILTTWADNNVIASITDSLFEERFVDMDGNILDVGDLVVLIDDSELENDPPRRGDVLKVTRLINLESNFIECGKFSLFGDRLLKVKKIY
jgi:uncharacterized Zn ribbon protein